ncbi:MAG: putative diguanylate cyclase YedQ [Firmicutes bacterium ADurb.Bin354]|nr:MAG: putative diguanylate cyclase YedQ [Firmicutes bacterium ADurb.Bin354]
MDTSNERFNPADGSGLLGETPEKSVTGESKTYGISDIFPDNIPDSVPGITATVGRDIQGGADDFFGEDLINNIFEISNELYLKMRDPATSAEEDHLTIISLLTDLGRRLVNADRASFWRQDKEKGTIWTMSATGTGKIEIPIGTGMVGKALKEGRSLVTNDPYNDPFFNAEVDKITGYITKSILVMPVTNSRGEYIGAYQVINKLDGDGKFNIRRDCKRLSLAAFICSITLESDLFLADAERDRLTKVRNRIGFYHDFSMRYGDGIDRRNNVVGSMIMCDIDHFKAVNDTYGHNAGDAVLRHVAAIAAGSLRRTDTVYRWGGEEFIVLLNDTGIEGAVATAEKIRAAVEESECIFDGTAISVTLSFGCGDIDPARSAEENIAVCDRRLYIAKESGRNRVVREG